MPLNILFFPIMPLLLLSQSKAYERLVNEKNLTAEELKYARRVKKTASKVIQTDLGLEAIFQLMGQIILLIFGFSSSKSEQGLTQIFGVDQNSWRQITALSFSIVWSMISCVRSYLRGISGAKWTFGLKSQVTVGVFALISIALKIGMAVVLFTPSLGLFSVLHHYEGSKTTYSFTIMAAHLWTNNNGTYGNGTVAIKDIIATNYGSKIDYTYFSLRECFLGFFAIIGLQTFFIFIAKLLTSPAFRRLGWFDMVIHSIENSNIPFPVEDWEECHGTIQQHRDRKNKVRNEVFTTIFINFCANIVHLVPFTIFGK